VYEESWHSTKVQGRFRRDKLDCWSRDSVSQLKVKYKLTQWITLSCGCSGISFFVVVFLLIENLAERIGGKVLFNIFGYGLRVIDGSLVMQVL
jgi:hypothetical protein